MSIIEAMFRSGVPRLIQNGLPSRLCKAPMDHNVIPVAFLTRKAMMGDRPPRPPPFPYWKKNLRGIKYITDPVHNRFDENSRLIVVEGLPAVGKAEVAKRIADEFGMVYMPSPTFDEYYVNIYGFDYRSINSQLPETAKYYDLKDFFENPNHLGVSHLQVLFLIMRLEQYITANLHILSTGEGVVLNRCIYADDAFMSYFAKKKFVTADAYRYYSTLFQYVENTILRPHLIIYLDVPVKQVKENIIKRGIPYEVNSKVITTEFLSHLENYYKKRYLASISNHTHILCYDWSKKGDIDIIIDDMTQVDLDTYGKDGKMDDWYFDNKAHLSERRLELHYLLWDALMTVSNENMPREFLVRPSDDGRREEILKKIGDAQYAPGFNPLHDDEYSDHHIRLPVRKSPRDSQNPEVQKRIKKFLTNGANVAQK